MGTTIGLTATALVAYVLIAAKATRVPGSRSIRRGLGWLAEWAKEAPATTVFWCVVTVHIMTLLDLTPAMRDQILRVHSTNLRQFGDNLVFSLVTSAFWAEIPDFAFLTVMAIFVLAPAERWLGTPRAIIVFFVGHVVASVLTTLSTNRLIHLGFLTADAYNQVDVGVSLGTLCLVGVLAYRIRMPWRVAVMVALPLVVLASGFFYDRYSTAGHLRALLIGYALWPLTRAGSVRARLRDPWIRLRRHPTPVPPDEQADEPGAG